MAGGKTTPILIQLLILRAHLLSDFCSIKQRLDLNTLTMHSLHKGYLYHPFSVSSHHLLFYDQETTAEGHLLLM